MVISGDRNGTLCKHRMDDKSALLNQLRIDRRSAPVPSGKGWIWLGIKTFFVVSLFIWARASFPRYRYDQIMRLGWKVFIPLTLAYLVIVAAWMQTPWNIWK